MTMTHTGPKRGVEVEIEKRLRVVGTIRVIQRPPEFIDGLD
jgi:hypothetical protein